jgi:hypothetical protein
MGILSMHKKIAEKARQEKLTGCLFIATPCYGGMAHILYVKSLLGLQKELLVAGLDHIIQFTWNESLITRGRNELVAMFMAHEEATHMMFIDADINFSPGDVIEMFKKDVDLVVGAYPKKGLPIEYVLNYRFYDRPEGKSCFVDNELIEMHDGGCGFMMFKKDVIKRITEAHPELKYVPNSKVMDKEHEKHTYAVFDTMIDPESRVYLSEDYAFCRRFQDLGGKVWLYPFAKLDHVGSFVFPGDVNKIFDWKSYKEAENA